jgi:prepilin-type N-terminal cleavage/methylation domain-containing protein
MCAAPLPLNFPGGSVLMLQSLTMMLRAQRRPTGQRPPVNSRGFTLAELMVVVLIMGILATIGLSSFSRHQDMSKTTEAVATCRSIGAAQSNYKALHHTYLNVSPDLVSTTSFYPVNVPGQQIAHFWGQNTHPDNLAWIDLAPVVPAYTQFGFATIAGLPPAANLQAVNLGPTQAIPAWPATINDPWYIVKAVGDLNGDGQQSMIIMSSLSDVVYQEFPGE